MFWRHETETLSTEKKKMFSMSFSWRTWLNVAEMKKIKDAPTILERGALAVLTFVSRGWKWVNHSATEYI